MMLESLHDFIPSMYAFPVLMTKESLSEEYLVVSSKGSLHPYTINDVMFKKYFGGCLNKQNES